MVDVLITLFTAIETVLIAAGVTIAYQVARMTTRAPRGWWFLVASFALAMVRVLLFLVADLSGSEAASSMTYLGQVLGLPIIISILLGVYDLYTDFRRQLKEMQASMVAHEP